MRNPFNFIAAVLLYWASISSSLAMEAHQTKASDPGLRSEAFEMSKKGFAALREDPEFIKFQWTDIIDNQDPLLRSYEDRLYNYETCFLNYENHLKE